MSLLEAIVLGLIQGLTEFIPVSSSGHLVIAQEFLTGFKQPSLLFDIMLHVGTLGAALIYFRRDLKQILISVFSGKSQSGAETISGRKLGLMVIIGSVPTAVIGVVFKDIFESFFNKPELAAGMLLITAVMLWGADRIKKADHTLDKMTWANAVLIGIIQGCAIIPGISRSGSTIATGIFCKLERDLAARYSFLLMIPAVSGATLLEARHLIKMWQSPDNIGFLLAGTLTALGVGYVTIDILMRIVRQKRLSYFAYYCLAVGLLSLILLAGR